MRVSLRLLRYFVATAESGSTTAAAKSLNVSQPSISVAIRELESFFDDTLFARESGTKMTLTRFGVRKLAEARQLLHAAASFEADDSGNAASGEVQIGVFSTIAPVYLPALLRMARARYPELAVRFVEGDLLQLEEGLRSSHIELALMYDVGLPGDIDCETLAQLEPYALVPAGSKLAKKSKVSLHDLAKEPLILIDLPHSREFLMAPFWQCGLSPEVRYRATSLELARSMVAHGLGVSLLITQSEAGSAASGAVGRPIREATIRQPLVIARSTRASQTRASALVAQCIRDAVADAMSTGSGSSGAARAGRSRPASPEGNR